MSAATSLAILSQTMTLHTHLQTTRRGLDLIDEEVETSKAQVPLGQLAILRPGAYLAEAH